MAPPFQPGATDLLSSQPGAAELHPSQFGIVKLPLSQPGTDELSPSHLAATELPPQPGTPELLRLNPEMLSSLGPRQKLPTSL